MHPSGPTWDVFLAHASADKAAVTHARPNVYFEAGLAMGLNIPIIWTVQAGELLHFDTRQYPHLEWTDADGLRQALVDRIGALGLTGRR